MRSLDEIQSDLLFLFKRKKSFFGKLFFNNEYRLLELRKEEYKCIDHFLLKEDPEYIKIALSNIALLNADLFKMKVKEATYSRRRAICIDELEGEIDPRGWVFCKGRSSVKFFKRQPVAFKGSIDHLGRVLMQAEKFEVNFFKSPFVFKGAFYENGKFTIEKTNNETDYEYYYEIKSMIGDPFNGNSKKRISFLANKKLLVNMIEQKRIAL